MKWLNASMICLGLLLNQGNMFSWAYLWEMQDESSRSCCLHYCGVDICNPYKPCTRFVKIDLTGILDYITRLSTMDHAKLEPHNTTLAQLKTYIRSILYNPHRSLSYQIPEYKSVKFYHDIVEIDFLKSKEKKDPAAKGKNLKDDPVAMQLVKMGLLQKRR